MSAELYKAMPPPPPRSQLQRRDLGPVVHALGSDIYDHFLERAEAGSPRTLDPEANFNGLANYMVGRDEQLLETIDFYTKDPATETAVGFFDCWLQEKSRFAATSLTHYTNARRVLHEGLSTGIFFPINVCLRVERLSQSPGVSSTDGFIAENLPLALQREDIRGLITQMAHAPNGFYTGSISQRIFPPDNNHIWASPRRTDLIAYDPTTGTVGLSEVGRQNLVAERRQANHNTEKPWTTQSGGCPVRHSGFPVLGEFATKFFDKFDYEVPGPGTPSLIEKGVDVATRLIELGLLESAKLANAEPS